MNPVDEDDDVQIIEDDADEESDEDASKDTPKNKNIPKITVDMTNIPTAQCDDDDELAGLGVKIYNQSQYEEGVMNQIDQALERDNPTAVSKKSKLDDLMQESDFTTVDLTKIDRRSNSLGIRKRRSRSPQSDSGDEWKPSNEPNLESEHDEDEIESVDDDASDYETEVADRRTKRKHSSTSSRKKAHKRIKHETESDFRREDNRDDDDRNEVQLTKVKKVQDDGNEVHFRKRLKNYYDDLVREREAAGLDGEAIDEFEVIDESTGFQVPLKIWSKLYPFQQACVRWLWQLHQSCVGGIIGDEMGLGKTIQVISFLAALRSSKVENFRETFKTLGPTIIVCPATVMHQWVSELHKWFPPLRVAILHSSGSYSGSKATLIRIINKAKGILVTTYSCINDYQDYLMPLEWHYIILDEGHKIRNPDAQVTLAVKRFRTPHRIILSGSPIQNNLKELWSLFDFIYPGKLGTLPVFTEQFSVPITQGGYSNASDVQVKIAFKCATVLRDTIKPYLLRRMKDDVKDIINLPNKNEQVLFTRLTEEQRKIYQDYLDTPEIKDIIKGSNQMFVGLINLRKICNHPDLFTCLKADPSNKNQMKRSINSIENYGYYKKSGKMHVVDALLKLWMKQGHKVLLFTQGTQMIDIIEKYLVYRNYPYLRLDGSTPIGQRQNLISTFNSNKDLFIFLLTTRVGGIGVNLTSASRVLIYDPDWNPSTDMQARERAWRIGQDQQVTIYRLLTAGTIEEKIYQRQVFKQYLTNKVLKDPKQRRFFKTKDLYELFSLGSDESKTESSAIFAGTGSEVTVPDKKCTEKEKKSSKSETCSKINHPNDQVTLPPEKIEELRLKAKQLSQMLAAKFNTNKSNNSETASTSTESINKSTIKSEPMSDKKKVNEKEKEISKDKSSRKDKKGVKFEGKRIKYLVKKNSQSDQYSKKLSEKQDEYVLQKLFKKSSTAIHSAIQHDVIEGASNPDFTLVEAEAEKIAEEAIEALKRSRSSCFAASSGIPNWTGSSGAMKKSTNGVKPSFGVSSSTGSNNSVCSSSSSSSSSSSLPSTRISSSNLIGSIKARNRIHADTPVDLYTGAPLNNDHGELLDDLRSFVAFQASRSGEATTQEVLDKFRHRIPTHETPVFKALLWKICDFHRKPDGKGVWKLKYEFS